MKQVRRFIGIGLAWILAVPVLGGMPVPAAAAAGTTIYVDDGLGNNGSVTCVTNPLIHVYPTIEQGMAAIGPDRNKVTLYICPGTYTPANTLLFQGFTGLKIIGKGSPVIESPDTFNNSLLRFETTTGLLVQGLVIDGQNDLPDDRYSVAIDIVYSSGAVSGNTIRNWRQATLTPANNHFTLGISDYAPGAAQKVTISNNTIYNSGEFGIVANEAGAPKISKNRIFFTSALEPAWSFAGGAHIQAGIMLLMTGPGATVSGNQILSDEDTLQITSPEKSRGIELYSASKAKVTGNSIRGVAIGISLESFCDVAAIPDTSQNTISGNLIYDAFYGIAVYGTGAGAGCDDPQLSLNKITGNKIYTNQSDRFTAGVYINPEGTATATGNIVTKNTFAGLDKVLYSNSLPPGTYAPNTVLPVPPAGVLK